MVLDEYLKGLRESGEEGKIMADKLMLLDKIMGRAMKKITITRTDKVVPFVVVFPEKTDITTFQEVYLPVSTIFLQILEPILNDVTKFIASSDHKEDKKEYISPTSHKPLDASSYAEGISDCLVGLGITFENTLREIKNIVLKTAEGGQPQEVKPSGDKDTDILSQASILLNSIPKIK